MVMPYPLITEEQREVDQAGRRAVVQGVGSLAEFMKNNPLRTVMEGAYIADPTGITGVAEAMGQLPDPADPGSRLPGLYEQMESGEYVGAGLTALGAIPIVGAPSRVLKALRKIDPNKPSYLQPPEVQDLLRENPEIMEQARVGKDRPVATADAPADTVYGSEIMRVLEPGRKPGKFRESSARNVLKSRIEEMRYEGFSTDEINRAMEEAAVDLKVAAPPRAFNDPAVEYVSTDYLLKNVARGNPTRYNVQEIDSYKRGSLGENPGAREEFLEEGRFSLKEDIYNRGIEEPIEITVSKKDGAAVISEGNHRLRAAQELGITEVPVKVKVRNRDPYIDPEQSAYRGERPTELDVSGLEEGDYSLSEIGFADRVEGPKPPPSMDYDERGMPQGSFAYDLDMSPEPDPKNFTPMREDFKKFENGGVAGLSDTARDMFKKGDVEEVGIFSALGNLPNAEAQNIMRQSGRTGSRGSRIYYPEGFPVFQERLEKEYGYPVVPRDFRDAPEHVRNERPRHDMPTYQELEDAYAHTLGGIVAGREFGPETATTLQYISEGIEKLPIPLIGGATKGDYDMDVRNNLNGIRLAKEAGSPGVLASEAVLEQLDKILDRKPEERSFKSPKEGADVYFPRDERGYFDTRTYNEYN